MTQSFDNDTFMLSSVVDDLPHTDISLIKTAMAGWIIIRFLGSDFYERNFIIPINSHKFFQNKKYVLLTNLADSIWQVKSCAGFNEMIARANKDDFEATFYELWFARKLNYMAHNLSFNVPSGVKGSDFDINVENFHGIQKLNFEVKARKESFKSTPQLKSFLAKCRRQLPETCDNAIGIKININNSISFKEIERTICSYLQATRRIKFVTIIWDDALEANALAYYNVSYDRNGVICNLYATQRYEINIPSYIISVARYKKRMKTERDLVSEYKKLNENFCQLKPEIFTSTCFK